MSHPVSTSQDSAPGAVGASGPDDNRWFMDEVHRHDSQLKAYLHGILSRCRHPLNTSIVEGINNTIKVIKRRAYSYRDQAYFFLKIRAAFHGI